MKLPEPAFRRLSDLQSGVDDYYTAAQMRQYRLDALVSEAIAQYGEIGEVLLGGVDDSGEYEECEVEIPQRTLYSLQEQLLKSTLPMRLKLYVRIEPIAATNRKNPHPLIDTP